MDNKPSSADLSDQVCTSVSWANLLSY